MGVQYIPVLQDHKCRLPGQRDAFQYGHLAPGLDLQVKAGVFYECECGRLWVMSQEDIFYNWKLVRMAKLHLGWLSPWYRKYRKAKKNGLLLERDHDEIVKELTEELVANPSVGHESVGR